MRRNASDENTILDERTILVKLTHDPISIDEAVSFVMDRNAGAVNTFMGTVREYTQGRKTDYLIYEAYESFALKQMEEICREVTERWDNVRIAMIHRLGKLDISDIAVVISVSTPHRVDAYMASRHAIERLKASVAIWKKEFGEDGEFWVENCCTLPAAKEEQAL